MSVPAAELQVQENAKRLGPNAATPGALRRTLRKRTRKNEAGRLTRRLGQLGLAVRDASNFLGFDDRFIRVALRTTADNDQLLEALRRVLAEDG